MRYVVISRLAPGDGQRCARHSRCSRRPAWPREPLSTWAGTDGKTFINVVESDAPDTKTAATYAPFFDQVTVIPVVDLDGAWLEAIQAAQSTWG